MTLQQATIRSITEAMKELKISRAELARRMKISRSAVTQMFHEGWTIDRLQDVAESLGCSCHIHFNLPPEA